MRRLSPDIKNAAVFMYTGEYGNQFNWICIESLIPNIIPERLTLAEALERLAIYYVPDGTKLLRIRRGDVSIEYRDYGSKVILFYEIIKVL